VHINDLYLQFLFSGLTLGSIYALIALALVTTYNITGILNMAQGEFVALGALSACTFSAAGFSLPAAFCLSVIITALVGGLVERLAINPIRNGSSITLIIVTIGLSIMLRGLALLIWGTNPYSLPAFTQGGPFDGVGRRRKHPEHLDFWTSNSNCYRFVRFHGKDLLGKGCQSMCHQPSCGETNGYQPIYPVLDGFCH